MVLKLSEADIEEIKALQEMFHDACFNITENHISVEMNLKDVNCQKVDKKVGVYGCILQMYYDKIDVDVILAEQRAEIIHTLHATKEMFEAMCGKGVSFNSETVDKLLVYFTE